MIFIWRLIKYATSLLLLVGLVFSSGVLSVLLYGKLTGKEWALAAPAVDSTFSRNAGQADKVPVPTAAAPTTGPKASAHLEAPVVRQNPELPKGCEISSLTMLLQYRGVNKTKMDLLPDLKFDPTELKRKADGSIAYWGNPNDGFVGDITGNSRGFGIFHTALMDLLQKYVPGGIDLTAQSFGKLESQIASGIPVVVWTTVDYNEPVNWVEWDTPTGRVRTTFAEHAVLLVGFDEGFVYVNDPLSGAKAAKIDKKQFIRTWDVMGKQAISYTNS